MLLPNKKIAEMVVFFSAFGGVFIFGKLPLWLAVTAILLPILFIDMLFKRPKLNAAFSFFIIALLVVSIINVQNLHLTTVTYSLFLSCVFLLSKRKIELCKPEALIKIYKSIIIIFFILFILGIVLYLLLGVTELSLIKVDVSRGIPRSYGPTTEPSYAAITLTISMWVLCSSVSNSYLKIRGYLFIYLISIILIGSGIGFITCAFLLMYIFFSSNFKVLRAEKFIILVALLLIFPFLSIDIERLKPVFTVLADITEFGTAWELFDALKLVDASAWFRFGPFVEYILDVEMNQITNFLFGNGAGASTAYFGEKYIEHIDPEWFNEDGKPIMDLAFFPAFLYDYGFIVTLLFVGYVWNLGREIKGSLFLIPIACLVFFNSNYNTSLFWFFIYSLLVMNVISAKEVLLEKNKDFS